VIEVEKLYHCPRKRP